MLAKFFIMLAKQFKVVTFRLLVNRCHLLRRDEHRHATRRIVAHLSAEKVLDIVEEHFKIYDPGFQQSNTTSPSCSLAIKTIKDGDIDVTKVSRHGV